MKRAAIILAWILCFSSASIVARAQATNAKPNRLVTAKIAYVAPMPDNLDQWLIQDLRAWGQYQISGNSQGVDLVIRAKKPQEKHQYVLRGGMPVEKKQRKTPPVLSITVTDWVTGEKLWQADILDQSPKKNQNPTPGPSTEIYARHMAPDQIAQRCATLLRRYVTELEQTSGK